MWLSGRCQYRHGYQSDAAALGTTQAPAAFCLAKLLVFSTALAFEPAPRASVELNRIELLRHRRGRRDCSHQAST
jgi:hypothetical protein